MEPGAPHSAAAQFRCSPTSGHSHGQSACLKRARTGLVQRSKNAGYSITLSALLTSVAGTVSPSAFAVLSWATIQIWKLASKENHRHLRLRRMVSMRWQPSSLKPHRDERSIARLAGGR
jgi:hypothetical protein